MKTYIFSNCKKSDIDVYAEKLFKTVKVTDRLIILNKGNVFYQLLPKYESKLKKYQNIHTLHRNIEIYGVTEYFGLLDTFKHRKLFSSIITFCPEEKLKFNTAKIQIGCRKTNASITKHLMIPWLYEYHEATGKIPTTGYAAYYLAKQLFDCKPEDIILVNYYGDNDNSTNKFEGHDWSFENEWLKKKNRIFL